MDKQQIFKEIITHLSNGIKGYFITTTGEVVNFELLFAAGVYSLQVRVAKARTLANTTYWAVKARLLQWFHILNNSIQ